MTSRTKEIYHAALESLPLYEVDGVLEDEIDTSLEPGDPVSDEAAAEVLSQPVTEVSLEASIKELRSGMKVRFSHGHGKIAKIFTGPFKLDGKHHHATKDAPLYLVRADKGGKHSLHKASALKPVK